MSNETIGFIGLGSMGLPIATNIQKAGYALRVYNRTAEKAQPLVTEGAIQAQTPGGVAQTGSIVITILSNDKAVEDVVLGPNGILGKLGPGGIHISMSTISPETSKALAAKHAEHNEYYIAAPVFGRPEAAAAGKLLVCLSGQTEAKERIKPIIDAVGQGTYDFGTDVGAANIVKLSGNFLIAAAMESMAEAYTLAEKNGIDPNQVHELFSKTLFACPIYQNYGIKIANKQYTPVGFQLPLGRKDMGLVLQAAQTSLVPMPLASLLHDRFTSAVAKGRTDLDWTGMAQEVSEAAGL